MLSNVIMKLNIIFLCGRSIRSSITIMMCFILMIDILNDFFMLIGIYNNIEFYIATENMNNKIYVIKNTNNFIPNKIFISRMNFLWM